MTHLFLLCQQCQHVLHINKCTLDQPAQTHVTQSVLVDAATAA